MENPKQATRILLDKAFSGERLLKALRSEILKMDKGVGRYFMKITIQIMAERHKDNPLCRFAASFLNDKSQDKYKNATWAWEKYRHWADAISAVSSQDDRIYAVKMAENYLKWYRNYLSKNEPFPGGEQ